MSNRRRPQLKQEVNIKMSHYEVLYRFYEAEILKVGKDCPYFDDGHTTATVIWDGNQVLGILGPWNEGYDRSN